MTMAFGTGVAGWTAIEGWEITHGSNIHGGSYKWVVRTHKAKAEAIAALDVTGEWYRVREIPKGGFR